MENVYKCHWVKVDMKWITDCNNEFYLSLDTPKDNGMVFCCFCGDVLES